MKILITGGAGYIGMALAEKLAGQDHVEQIILYDNMSRHNELGLFGTLPAPEKFNLIRGDILDSRSLKKALRGVDVVFHLAGKVLTPFAHQDPHFFEQINHWGTAELVYALEDSKVQHCIYLSSASVYGRSDSAANESSVPNPNTYYGISKLRGEEHVLRLFSKMRTCIIRCGNVYGYGRAMRFDAVINNFMLQANFENKISIQGTGAQQRAFIEVRSVADALAQLPHSETPSGVYNLVTKNLAINDIAEAIAELYPHCDRIFIDQHLKLGSITVDPNSALSTYISIPDHALAEELAFFKAQFAFSKQR
ncbi:MAG: NAD-dependent epimerase/dehydratase [Chitinophagales bacterium]